MVYWVQFRHIWCSKNEYKKAMNKSESTIRVHCIGVYTSYRKLLAWSYYWFSRRTYREEWTVSTQGRDPNLHLSTCCLPHFLFSFLFILCVTINTVFIFFSSICLSFQQPFLCLQLSFKLVILSFSPHPLSSTPTPWHLKPWFFQISSLWESAKDNRSAVYYPVPGLLLIIIMIIINFKKH